MEITTRTAEQKIGLIQKWAKIFYDNTATLYADAGDLGGQIAYLYHAITDNGTIELHPDSDLLELLKEIDLTPEDRAEILGYIELTCPCCGTTVELGKPHYLDSLDGHPECEGSIEANGEAREAMPYTPCTCGRALVGIVDPWEHSSGCPSYQQR